MYRWKMYKCSGFTLAELLSALAILGVIATFTIPKVLQASTNGQYNSSAKEVASMFVNAYDAYRLNNSINASTSVADLTPYMNYVSVDTSGASIDAAWTDAGDSCSGLRPCLILHNGGVFHYDQSQSFGGTTDLHTIWGEYIIDRSFAGDKDRGVRFNVYTNARLMSRGSVLPGTTSSTGAFGSAPDDDPPWFSW